MNETILTIEDAARRLPEVVQRVHSSGNAAILTQSGHRVARIVRDQSGPQGTDSLIAFLRQWRIAHPEPDEQFGDAIEESRRAVQPPHDPWE
jgi:antitoxin (DNA-binding transcriptional repressor) of toxin-antitoxin stability system